MPRSKRYNKQPLNRHAFAEYLRRWIESNNADQVSIADRAGIAPATISNWLSEKVEPELSMMGALEDATGVPWEKWASLLLDKPYTNVGATNRVAPKRGVVRARMRRRAS